MSTLAISLLGAGRMGREIMAALAGEPDQCRLAGVWARPESSIHREDLSALAGDAYGDLRASSDLPGTLVGADIAIDFTLPEATAQVVEAARKAGTPLVCGVSGIAAADMRALHAAAADIPIFFARNMSIGIALLQQSVAQASAVLGVAFQIDIEDLHHALKKDAPSGTALLLGEAAAAARGQDFSEVMHYTPGDDAAPREPGAIVFRARREGNFPGTHEVRFSNASEELTFGHAVSNRRVFAAGALRAARWLHGKPAGFYGMQDLLADRGSR